MPAETPVSAAMTHHCEAPHNAMMQPSDATPANTAHPMWPPCETNGMTTSANAMTPSARRYERLAARRGPAIDAVFDTRCSISSAMNSPAMSSGSGKYQKPWCQIQTKPRL